MEENSKKLLSIIFINYKSTFLLEQSLDSLKNQNFQRFQVIIVDNTPGNKDYKILKEISIKYSSFFEIFLEKPKYNLGYAGGNNFAIRKYNTPYYFLLNCDTEVEANSIGKIIEYMEKNTDVGMLSPKMYFYENKSRIYYAGAKLNLKNFYYLKMIGYNQEDQKKFQVTKETSYAHGAALLVRKEVIEKIGLIDELFFCYFEETDWNYRAKENGYKIIYYSNSIVYHKVPIPKKGYIFTDFRNNNFKTYIFIRNGLIFFYKRSILKGLLYNIHGIIELIIRIRMNSPKLFLLQFRSIIYGNILGIRRKTNRSCSKYIRDEMKFINTLNKITNSQKIE